MRAILVDWLVEVHFKFKVRPFRITKLPAKQHAMLLSFLLCHCEWTGTAVTTSLTR